MRDKNQKNVKTPRNAKGQIHGKVEDYWSNGNLWEYSYYINDEPFGYSVYGYSDGRIKNIAYFCR
jgi:antitoxin component YwqK of YwqJK toxin-antitoxin module